MSFEHLYSLKIALIFEKFQMLARQVVSAEVVSLSKMVAKSFRCIHSP